MAKIIENDCGRRMIRLNVDDVISVVKMYQIRSKNISGYEALRLVLSKEKIFLPEDV